MRIGLTGSTGMIGRHMVALLKAEDSKCVCITRNKWDLCDWKTVQEFDQLFSNVDAVFHFGATLPKTSAGQSTDNKQTQTIFDANVRSCLNLAEWALLRKVPIVFLSGATVYADPHAQKIKEQNLKVVNGFGGFYGYSKLLAENVFEHFVASGLKLIMLRPSSVYGIGLGNDKLISNYLSMASKNKTIHIETPNNRINFVHSLDVSIAALSAFKHKAWGNYNIASDSSTSIGELAELSIKICGTGRVHSEVTSDEGFLRFDLDITKAQTSFMYKPVVSIKQGMTLMYKKRELLC